ncbi:MAG: hypothetical protein AAF761_12340 [Pseudomonadota bacterium]
MKEPPPLRWSVADAQAARAAANARPFKALSRFLTRVDLTLAGRAAALSRPGIYHQRLNRRRTHMNRARWAFDSFGPGPADVAVSAYF